MPPLIGGTDLRTTPLLHTWEDLPNVGFENSKCKPIQYKQIHPCHL